jgi:hypothetical protein
MTLPAAAVVGSGGGGGGGGIDGIKAETRTNYRKNVKENETLMR